VRTSQRDVPASQNAVSLLPGIFDLLLAGRFGFEPMRMQPLNLVYFVGLVVYVTIRGVFGGRTKKNEKVVSRVDVSDRALVAAVFLGSMVLPMLYLFSPWLRFADYRLPAFVNWSGAVVMVIALWLFWRAHVDLGLNWSITLEMRKNHELIVHGVYRRIRHPMYAAIFLFAVAQALLLQNWLAGWAGFASFWLLYLVRMPREEKMMCDFFGEPYRAYMKRTGRLVPRLDKS
jgi:protein-S-isoprenylcysteine O-methyltransferase Ste14